MLIVRIDVLQFSGGSATCFRYVEEHHVFPARHLWAAVGILEGAICQPPYLDSFLVLIRIHMASSNFTSSQIIISNRHATKLKRFRTIEHSARTKKKKLKVVKGASSRDVLVRYLCYSLLLIFKAGIFSSSIALRPSVKKT
jgi:hypothetical protein